MDTRCLGCFTLIITIFSTTSLAERVKRPMTPVEIPALELQIAVELEPEWIWNIDESGGRPMAIVQSPENYYPPTVMAYISFPRMHVEDENLRQVATDAIRQAARNYAVPEEAASAISPITVSHGEFSGYEASFSGFANEEEVDVRVFVGQDAGSANGPIAMQTYTLKGKLPHISEQIRRAWENVRYLEQASDPQASARR